MKRMIIASAVVCAMVLTACNNQTDETKSTETTVTADTSMTKPMVAETETGVMVGGANMVASKNIVENAMNSADHTTLVAAVKQAGLVETLSGTGPFTVFAPTNEAFDALPAGTVDGLLKPENMKKLQTILTYHVVPGMIKAADLKDGQKLKTVQGEDLTVSIKDGKVMINGANVTIADAVSSNGVTHIIDKVLMPKM